MVQSDLRINSFNSKCWSKHYPVSLLITSECYIYNWMSNESNQDNDKVNHMVILHQKLFGIGRVSYITIYLCYFCFR